MSLSKLARHRAFGALLALGAPATACGPKVVPASIVEEDDPRAAAERARPARSAPAALDGAAEAQTRPLAPPGAQARAGTIDRAALVRVLDAGPGALLRALEISPSFERDRFVGWRIDQIVDRASPLAAVDLAPGDVVLSVNGRPLARPEQVMAIWLALRTADELRCEVWRGSARLTLRFAIAPAAGPPAAAAGAPAAGAPAAGAPATTPAPAR